MAGKGRLKRTNLLVVVVVVIVLAGLIVWKGPGLFTGRGSIPRIGITQFVEHPALDAAREGFIAGLAEKGFVEGEDIEIIFENAQADFTVAQTIARKFKQDNLDLVLAIATPTAQAAASVLKETPVLITAVTDPVAAGLVESMEEPGGNITGTTDMNPVAEQIRLIKDFIPEVKKVGILYNSGEVNSVIQVKIARKAAEEMGISLVEATVTSSNDVALAVSSLVDKVDAIYIPTDNTVVSSMPAVINITNPKKVPVFGSERGQVEQGAVATRGIDYFLLGKQTGRMAAEILQGKDPAELPIEGSKELKLVINQQACKQLGLEVPEQLLHAADEVID